MHQKKPCFNEHALEGGYRWFLNFTRHLIRMAEDVHNCWKCIGNGTTSSIVSSSLMARNFPRRVHLGQGQAAPYPLASKHSAARRRPDRCAVQRDAYCLRHAKTRQNIFLWWPSRNPETWNAHSQCVGAHQLSDCHPLWQRRDNINFPILSSRFTPWL